MYTHAFIKQVPGVSVENAHIHEHLFIDSFFHYAASELGIHPAVVGMVAGETFNGFIMIDVWLYDERINALFQRSIKNQLLDDSMLPTIVAQIESEDKRSISITRHMKETMSLLKQIPWEPLETFGPLLSTKTTDEEKKPAQRKKTVRYKSVVINCYLSLKELSIEDRAVFERLSVIILDIFESFINENGWYRLDSASVSEMNGYLRRPLSVGLPQSSMKNADIERRLEEMIRDFDWDANYSYVHSHMKAFSNQALWKAGPMYRFETTSVIAGNKVVAALATKERVIRLFELLSVQVFSVTREVAKNLDKHY